MHNYIGTPPSIFNRPGVSVFEGSPISFSYYLFPDYFLQKEHKEIFSQNKLYDILEQPLLNNTQTITFVIQLFFVIVSNQTESYIRGQKYSPATTAAAAPLSCQSIARHDFF